MICRVYNGEAQRSVEWEEFMFFVPAWGYFEWLLRTPYHFHGRNSNGIVKQTPHSLVVMHSRLCLN